MYSSLIYQKLPKPFTITAQQIRSFYRSYYDKLLESYQNNDFYEIVHLLTPNTKSIILKFSYPILDDDSSSEDTLLSDFVKLLYQIITIYPVKYYKAQMYAASFLSSFLEINKKITGVTLDWKSYYKVKKFFINKTESNFLSGRFFTRGMNQYLLSTNFISHIVFKDLVYNLSIFFPDETETKIDGLTVKTNTTDQLVKKFIPFISVDFFTRPKRVEEFCNFLPLFKGQYKKFIEYFLLKLRNPRSEYNETILIALNKIIMINIEDDFSFILPIISNLISDQILTNKSLIFTSLSNIIVSLFISPPTRKATLDLIKSFLESIKSKCHPSLKNTGLSNFFINEIVISLNESLRTLRSKKKNKIFFKMDEKLGPSQDEIHKFLSTTSEINIMDIRNCFDIQYIIIETFLDPLTIDHYFEIAMQFINFTDALGIATNGWIILTALILSIDKNEKIRENFSEIFLAATNNLLNSELQCTVSNFLLTCLIRIPFDREKTLKGLEKTDFCSLANSFFTNLFSAIKFSPAAKDEKARINPIFMSGITLCIQELFMNCEKEIFDELLPIFTQLAYDEDISKCMKVIEIVTANYCRYASKEQAQKIEKAFKSNLDLSSSNLSMFKYLSLINSTIIVSSYRTLESVKKTIYLILPYTKNENEKIRKAAFYSLIYGMSSIRNQIDPKVSLKPEKMKENQLEKGKLDDFDIEFKTDPDLSELDLEVLDPYFDKMMQIKDQYELISFLGEISDDLSSLMQDIYQYTEGSKDDINEIHDNSINIVPELIKKSVPVKDKFVKCLVRIIHDFPENTQLVSVVIKMLNSIILPKFTSGIIYFIPKIFMKFDNSKKNLNKDYLYNLLVQNDKKRKELFVVPLTDDIKEVFNCLINLTISNTKEIRSNCARFLHTMVKYYSPFIRPAIEKIFEKMDSIPINVFVSFLAWLPDITIILNNSKLCCQTFLFLLKNFNENEKDNDFLNDLKHFVSLASEPPHETVTKNEKDYVDLLNELEANYLNKNRANRSYRNMLLCVIIMCLKHVKDINDNILEFVVYCITHYDQQISVNAETCFTAVMSRRIKFTKERIDIKKFPTVETIPNILDKVTVKFPPNGVYFPSIKSTESEEITDDDYNIQESLSCDYSIDISPTNSIEVNIENTKVNEDVIKIFDTFKKVEFDFQMTEEERILYDGEYMFTKCNGNLMFKDHYTHKKYEFTNNKMLLKKIPDIFSSAINALNEKSLRSGVSYCSIWNMYSLSLGPFCTKKLSKITKKYLSEYFEIYPEITSIILYDMVNTFLLNIVYWNLEDRIEFIKLVVLPFFCVVSTSYNSAKCADDIIRTNAIGVSPFTLAPLIKVIFDMAQNEPTSPTYYRSFIIGFGFLCFIRESFFIKTIDQLKAKFIDPFITKMGEYKMTNIQDVSFLISCMFDCCFKLEKSSPLYSNEIELYKEKVTSIYDTILKKENVNDSLTHFLVHSFKLMPSLTYNSRISFASLIIKNIHTVFQLMKSAKVSNEESLFNAFGNFLKNDIFCSNLNLMFDLLTSLVGELMNSKLPLQMILLESVNEILESCIFNIQESDYDKYEELFLKYDKYEMSKNLGNELRMKIAKIVGIFEIRKCTLKKSDYDSEKVDEEVVLKAASIILNAYLFDHIEDKVTLALETMEKFCGNAKKGSMDNVFFNNVLEIFVQRHSGHVINEVEDVLTRYKCMTPPSYIS